jgi:DUF1680 family protein
MNLGVKTKVDLRNLELRFPGYNIGRDWGSWLRPSLKGELDQPQVKRMGLKCFSFLAIAIVIGGRSSCAEPSPDYPIHAVSARNVQLSDLFWSPRLETNRNVTIPLSFEMCEVTGRIENFKVAAGSSNSKWTGMFGFNDSDVYKVMEGAADSLATHPDAGLNEYLNRLITWINAAQEKDGYLYTEWTARDRIAQPNPIRCCVPNVDKKWFNEKDSHELYNAGHMIEAAVSHWEATGSDTLLKVAKKNADLLVETFGPGKLEMPSGHPEVELALVKLYRATKDERYLKLAKFLIDLRGRPTKDRLQPWGTYMQDNAPLAGQGKAVGHAVRAMYLYSAATDVAALTGDSTLGSAIDRIWENVVAQKTYVTGAIGATAAGEAFGADYELPNDKAYAETCASLATCFWNYRMFLRHGDAKYIDVLERALYNSAISGVALDGRSFFYANPLASKGNYSRSKWFDCACCPTNICRFIPSIPGYAYATQDDTVFVNLFAAGACDIDIPGGKLRLEQETNYPWDGHVRLKPSPEKSGQHAVLKIRIPGWARGQAFVSDLYRFADNSTEQYKIAINGVPTTPDVENGFAIIDRRWKQGDAVSLDLPMPVRRVVAHEKVEADRDRVALMRGPTVYCVEGVDLPKAMHPEQLVLADDQPITTEYRKDLLKGVQVITGRINTVAQGHGGNLEPEAEGSVSAVKEMLFTAVPYYAWANRGPSEMEIWIKRIRHDSAEGMRKKPTAK